MSTEVKVPVLPESVSDATIASWHKKPVRLSNAMRTSSTWRPTKLYWKSPPPVDGVLKEIKFDTGSTVTSNQVLAIIEEESIVAAPSPAPSQVIDQKPVADPLQPPNPTLTVCLQVLVSRQRPKVLTQPRSKEVGAVVPSPKKISSTLLSKMEPPAPAVRV